ncbi:MAG: esterase-like activity of phytase family protein [Candidatus Krumholzibacteria bacterium]|nr:esterase-like activity of phytase family protein [Candidatus Krumholzibacteria bacterium]
MSGLKTHPETRPILTLIMAALLVCLAAGCAQETAPTEPALATLTGRAVLPADTFSDGPAVGHELDPVINGRNLPFDSVPLQGFSSLLSLGDNQYLALQDNGFGSLANSPNYPLRWYRLAVRLDDPPREGGPVELLETVNLSDPHGLLPFALARDDSARQLTGADLDPESFVRLPDGSFWLGEEFGPSLIHFSAQGEVLEKPVDIPIVPSMRLFARGSPFYRTPDNPDLRFLRRTETRDELANQPRSGGIEGLALNPNGSRAYAAVEKGLHDDPVGERRVIMEFDPARRSFTGNHWLYLVDRPDVSIASLEVVSNRVLLVVERDTAEGKDAEIKRIYRVELGRVNERGFLIKHLVCDLLNIDDSAGLTHQEKGAVGLGQYYRFPYVTPECLVIIDDNTLLLANDNNYPMSTGRRPPKTPDDNEFIRLRLNRPLGSPPQAAGQ